MYKTRFNNFSTYLYKKVYGGQKYPLEYAEQALLIERPEDSILFLALNSCWQIDHYFTDRAGIHMEALTNALDKIQDGKYDDWLKIAVWHHPVTGLEPMNNEFMQLLAVNGFQVCMQGHIHEAIEGFHKYDDNKGIHVIGAGTFGAAKREQTPSIPLQYNILFYDVERNEIKVNTRKKEKPDGAWSADSRWGDKNEPKPYYLIKV